MNYKTIDPEVLNFSVWATIAPSKIHGVGIFAIRDIKKGQKLHLQERTREWIRTDLNKVEPEIKKIIQQRFPTERDGLPYLSPNADAYLISFINHSDSNNYDKYTDTALSDITKGQEITEDYGDYRDIIKL